MQTNPNQNLDQNPNPDQTGGNPNPNQNQNTDQNNGGGNPTEQSTISLDDMLAGIGQQLGGPPTDNEAFKDADPATMAILEEQYAMKVERAFDKMQREVKSKVPDATEGQVHEIGMPFMKGDIGAGIDAIQQALRQAEEVDNNNQEQKALHVEGGSGGNQSEGKNEGSLSSVFASIANTYGQRRNA